MTNAILFLSIFILIVNYYQIKLFALGLIAPNVSKKELKDKKILDVVKKKAGFDLDLITVIDSQKMFGGMSGLPGFPKMYLSSELLKNLSKQELEYVILHESAHFKFFHPLISGFSQITLILLGLYWSSSLTLLANLILGVVFSCLFLMVARRNERQAENFAASKMDNPKAMVTAVNKFESNWIDTKFAGLLKQISWNISYDEKRMIASKYI